MGFLLATMALGLLCRAWLIFGSKPGQMPEIFEYDELARNLLAGEGYQYTHLGTPYQSFYSGVFYIWLTAGLYAAFPHGYTAVLVAQSLCSLLVAGAIYSIGRISWGRQAGILAALLVLVHPAFIYYDAHKLHPLSFDALLIGAVVLTLLWLRKSFSAYVAFLAGVTQGAAILQRGSMILFLPFGLASLWWYLPRTRRFLFQGTVYVFGVLLVITPWLARNYSIYGTVLLTTTSAESFWRGNEPHSYGSSFLPSGQTVLHAAPETFLEQLRSKDELGQSQLFWQSSLPNVWARPGAFLLGVGRKFLHFWTFAPQTGLLYPPWYFYMYTVYYLTAASLAVLGAVRLARAGASRRDALPVLCLILGVFLSVSLIHSTFYFEMRHRWGIEPLLLVLSSVGVLDAWRRVKGGPRVAPKAFQ